MSQTSTVVGRSVLYPIGLKLEGRRCLVVGSGAMARKKIAELTDCGALVQVIAPEDGDRLFVPSDLDGTHLVVVATDDRRLQDEVSREATARGIPCNVVDVNHLCTFYAPAVLRRGSLTISVATDGKFPLLAVAIKDRIGAMLGDAIGPALQLLSHGRELACARFPNDPEARVSALRLLLSDEAIASILEGRLDDLRAHYESWTTQL
jgi:siroheme synthase-like protein